MSLQPREIERPPHLNRSLLLLKGLEGKKHRSFADLVYAHLLAKQMIPACEKPG